MDLNLIIAACAISACILSSISLIIGIYSMIKVLSMEKSTHSVQFVPADMQAEANWATDDKVIDDQNKMVKEDNEEFFGI